MLERMWGNKTSFVFWWEGKIVQPCWKTIWWFRNKTKHTFITQSGSQTPWYLSKEATNLYPLKTGIKQGVLHLVSRFKNDGTSRQWNIVL
jgi:hypothetical protein